jgi:ABC-2 type transport system permease protein
MEVIYIAYYTAMMEFKKKTRMTRTILFVLLLIPILGFSLDLAYKPFGFDNQKVEVYSNNPNAINSLQKFIDTTEYKDKIKLVRVNSNKVGTQNVNSRKSDAYIELEQLPDKSIKIKNVYVFYYDDYDVSLVKSLVSSYKSSEYEDKSVDNVINNNPIDLQNMRPTAIEYYSITMIVMIILYSSKDGMRIVNEARDKNMIGRVKSFPISYRKYMTGKIIGKVVIAFMQAMILILATKFIYRVNWGENFMDIIPVIFLFSIFSVNLGSALSSIIKNVNLTEYILELMVPIFTLIAGGYISSNYLSEKINNLGVLSPSYAVQNIIFKNIYGYNYAVNGFYLELVILSIVLFIVTMVFGRSRPL